MSFARRAADRIKSLVTLGRVTSSRASAGAGGRVQVSGMVSDEVRSMQPYGLASRPAAGAECVVLNVGSNADQAIVIVADDRRYRVALEGGEVALYDDLGSRVILRRGGIIEVEASEIRLGANPAGGAARQGDSVAVSGDWATWLLAVGTATGAGAPPVDPIGSISTSSSKVRVQ